MAGLMAQVLRDLSNAVAGEVRGDAHDRLLYATDASLYQVEPLAVVIPRDAEDAVAALRVCHRHRVPVLPRGGGTSLAGQCTNRGVVIDFSPTCRAVLEVDAARATCRVEPGITIDDLNDHLRGLGGPAAELFFAPDPATSRQACIGGCIGNNAAGARSILFGRTSENVLAIDAALADGARVTFDGSAAARHPRALALTREVCRVVADHAGLIRERFPRTIRRNAGYGLDMILAQLEGLGLVGLTPGAAIPEAMLHRVSLAPLLCGSEGTLAVTLGATLRLRRRPGAKGLAVLGFSSLDGAIGAVVPILSASPSAVELLDDTVLGLAGANTECRRYVDLMPAPAWGPLAAVLYVEFFAEDLGEVTARFEGLRGLVPGAPMVTYTDEAAMLSAWKLRKAGEPLLHGIPGRRKPVTFIEDNVVPVERLSEFVGRLREIVGSHGTRAAFYAHASVGVLHVRPLIDVHDGEDRRRVREIAVAAADLARELGGVMSGEHGDGRVRTPLLERHFGPGLMGAFAAVKRAFDPANLLNPGNIVEIGADPPRDVESITRALRVMPAGRPVGMPPGADTFFDYADQHGFGAAVEMCNGAGVCRKKQGGTMCPSYMATLDERHSTRGRGNALRLAITGQMPGEGRWSDAGTLGTLDLCLSCKACKTECPSNVDIARLKAEYTGQHHRASGTPLRSRLFANVRTLNRLGSAMPALANAAGSLAAVRAVLNALLDIHPRRSLPRFGAPLHRRWPAPGVAAGAPTVALFGDCFTMFNEPSVGLATRRVFEALGYRVVLSNAGCCGRAALSMGVLDSARRQIDATLERLRPIIDDPGVGAVLVAEPSCLSAMKDDWLSLKVGSPLDLRRRLAAKAFLPEDFLGRHWERHPRRATFRQPAGGVLLHAHCHQKALWGAGTSGAALECAFPGRVRVLDTGCCGMAGSFGYSRRRFDLSMKIADLALLPAVRAAGRGDILAATGTSCRHQVHDGAGRGALHPMEVLASHLE
jgi:FAD/FMN-containing dehydrogenase/Fe-S oxidoreductase